MKNRLYTGFAVAILLVLIGSILSYITFRRQTREADWVQHTYEVITQAQRINRLIYDMQVSGNSYRIIQDKKFLDPYFATKPKLAPALENLKRLTDDNFLQTQQIDSLETEINRLVHFWESLGDDIPMEYVFEHQLEISLTEGKHLETVHRRVQNLVENERNLLVIRNNRNDTYVGRATVMLAFNCVLILIVAFTLMWFTFREFRNRWRAERKLTQKVDELVTLNEVANERNWLLTGMSRLNESLQGNAELDAMMEQFLYTLVSYLRYPAGALYYYDELSNTLRMGASVALPDTARQSYKLKEGMIGQAAMRRELMIMTDVPDSYWHIEGGAGKAQPGTVLLAPLWRDNMQVGVIELASFGTVRDRERQLVEQASGDIAVALSAASARDTATKLLQQLQQQKEVLETQQEELRQTNEELTRQSEILQASEEELRVQEEELRQVNDEMSEKNKALEITRQELSVKAQELEQTSKYKSEFLANMSHELRTPLNSVLILARLLEENRTQNLTPKQMEYAGIIHKSGSDLLELIDDILHLAKIEAGKIEMNFESEEIRDIVADMERLFRVVADEKKIRFSTKVALSVPDRIRTDRQRLEQVIKNLLSNAFKFTPANGTIDLTVEVKRDGLLYVEVRDTGTGIAAEKLQLIFEAFRQADGSTSRKYGGTGLGLSISKELTRRLGGEIRVESRVGEGSIFTVVLPVESSGEAMITAPVSDVKPAATFAAASPQPVNVRPPVVQEVRDDRDSVSKTDKLVLIIEDDATFAAILRDAARDKGYKVVVALNGNDGVYLARKFLPSAIILDMNLPLIDGSSILKILKGNEDLKHILVHVISAGEISAQVKNKVHGYTQKPLQLTDMETVFSGISQQLQAGFKNVLIVSNGGLLHNPSIQVMSDERQMETHYEQVASVQEAMERLVNNDFEGIILDVGKDAKAGIQQLLQLRQLTAAKNMPIIVYIDQDISEADEQQIRKEAAAIVRNSTFSADRLMDELELFLYKLKEAENNPERAEKLMRAADVKMEGKKILLADDDMRNVFSLSALLEGHGLDVITASDGKEALRMLDEHPDIQLVLMDIMMPEMDGYEAIRHIRANPKMASLPIIALTAKAMTGDREKCIQAGASDYVAKPVNNNKLLSLMRVWLA
ncbi:response regulator [Chitinophaga horti]|uniref:histidine kinase n=1 Tax=Chitinophaga horti TaxID=2920382 RepID=A0ABY6J5D0_9BACT|nr:response regulator [Chitinophaga horti]UYQ94827.1 response regulator [Chitinophaga horti]